MGNVEFLLTLKLKNKKYVPVNGAIFVSLIRSKNSSVDICPTFQHFGQ